MCPYEPGEEEKGTSENEPLNLEELGNPSPGDSFAEGFNPYEYTYTLGPDGLPVEASPPWQSQDSATIPLTPETVACLPQDKSAHNPEGLPPCKHYIRQRVHNPTVPDRPLMQRFCTHEKLRGINGACLSLDDAGIFECELRDPPDARAKIVLDRIDADKIDKGRVRLREEKATGKVHGYRMFRTPEDVKAGRTTLDENDKTYAELSRPKIDPFAPDMDPTESEAPEAPTPAKEPDNG